MKTVSFFRSCSSLIFSLSFATSIARSQTEIVARKAGTVMRYDYRGGGFFTDSVRRILGSEVFVTRVLIQGSTRTETIRHFRIGQSGAALVDDNGSQLLFPNPWPPSSEWSYVYRNSVYRYTPLGLQTLALKSGNVSALHVQLTIETKDNARAFDMWLTPDLQIVKRFTRPDGSPQDFELADVRESLPIQLPPSVSTEPSPPQVSQPTPQRPITYPKSSSNQWSPSNWFLGAGIGAIYSPTISAWAYADSAITPAFTVELGNRGGVLGFRARYGSEIPEEGDTSDPLQFGQFELTASTPKDHRASLFISGGVLGTNGGKLDGTEVRFFSTAGGGILFNLSRNFQAVVDGSFVNGIIPRYNTIASTNEKSTTGIFSFTLRYH